MVVSIGGFLTRLLLVCIWMEGDLRIVMGGPLHVSVFRGPLMMYRLVEENLRICIWFLEGDLWICIIGSDLLVGTGGGSFC